MTLYKNARLRGCTELKDIFVKDGKIEKIADSGTIAPENAEKIELDGRLVCEPYCDPHSFHRQYRQELTRPPQRLTLTQRTLQGRLQRAAMRTQRAIRGISSRLSLTR